MSFVYTEIIDRRSRHRLPDCLRLDRTMFPEAKLIRLILGTADLTCEFDNLTVPQRVNYSNALGSENGVVTPNVFIRALDPLLLQNVSAYLVEMQHSNRAFYENLLTEYSFFFYHSDRGNHTSAFVHLYRILEFISYSFPLIHASKSNRYYQTYDALKLYFSGDQNGELRFLRTFTAKLFQGVAMLGLTVDFNIADANAVLEGKIYTSYKRVLAGNAGVVFDDALKKFTICYGSLIDAIVTLRNRFCHFATGGHQENIKSIDVGQPDRFFEFFNKSALTWISMIYIAILEELSTP